MQDARTPGWPTGGSKMGALIRTRDWAATPLGPIETWPRSLTAIVDMLLANDFPMVALWGPDLVQIYNDGYRDLMGIKHPAGLGQPTRDCWPEVWHVNEPIYERVLAGETLTFDDALHPITRHGELEDAWFTLSYSPLRDESGDIAGVLVTVFETSRRVTAEVRLRESHARLQEIIDVAGLSTDVRALSEASPTPFLVVAPPDFAAVAVNDAYLRATMTERAEVLGRPLFEVFPDNPDDPEATGVRNLRASFEGVLATRRTDVMPAQKYDIRRSPEAGGGFEERWWRVVNTPVLGRHGDVACIIHRVEDVTELVPLPAEGEEHDQLARDQQTVIGRLREANAALRESEERFRALAEQAEVGIVMADLEGRIIYVNDRHCEIIGRPREEILGKTIQELTHRDDWPVNEALLRRMLTEGTPFTVEKRLSGPDEAPRWDRVTVNALRDADGCIVGCLAVTIDITDRKRAEEALRESEERFRLMADAVPQIVWITDPEGRAEFFNRQWTDYTGAPHEPTTAAEAAASYVHPEDGAATLEAFNEARRTGGTFRVEHRIRSATGEYRWFLVRAEPYRDSHTGEIVRWFGASVDIHDRKLAEEALRELAEARALHEATVVNLLDGLAVADLEDRVRLWNPRMAELIGVPTEAAVGRPIMEVKEAVFARADDPNAARADERAGFEAARAGRTHAMHAHLVRPAPQDVLTLFFPIRGPDGAVRAVGRLTRDVTREREVAIAEAVAAERRALLARLVAAQEEERRRVAYELHDGVTQLAAAAALHLDELASRLPALPADDRRELDRARQLARRAVDESRRLMAGLRPTTLDDFGLARAIGLEVEALRRDGWRATYREALGSERLPPTVEITLFRAAQEALTNVRRHAGRTSVQVRLEHRDGEVRLSVQDRGRGFDATAARQGAEPGLHVGLLGMRERVELLGGRCAVRSTPGSGTRVEVALPVAPVSDGG